MSHLIYRRLLLLLLILLVVFLTACGNSTPTPQTTTYTPGCSVQNLIDDIAQANNNPDPATINLDPSCVYTLTTADNMMNIRGANVHTGLPVISTDIIIQGNNAEIKIQKDTDEPNFGHFYVDSMGDLELYDLQLRDGIRPVGGAVINDGGDFYANNVSFIDNTAYPPGIARGGAIYSDSGRVRVINGCIFQNNQAGETSLSGANFGGAIYIEDNTLLVSSASFQGNIAGRAGGAIYSKKTQADESGGLVRFTDSVFNGNSAHQNGGAVALMDEIGGVFITTSTFEENNAGVEGGAIYSTKNQIGINVQPLAITESEFSDNSSQQNGGAIALIDEDGEVIISESSFLENIAGVNGGALYSIKNQLGNSGVPVTITESVFNGNSAQQNGGAVALIDEDGGVFISSTRLVENSAAGSGGGIFSRGSELTGLSNEFILNEAMFGGGVYTQLPAVGSLSSYSSESTWFNQNNAEIGGGIFSENSELSLNDGEFVENSAGSCGALRIGGSPNLNVLTGGLETATRIVSATEIYSVTFSDNAASQGSGGGACHVMGELSIRRSTFLGNSAADAGGGLIIHNEADLSSVGFEQNLARFGGGLMIGYPPQPSYLDNPALMNLIVNISGSRFVDNEADLYGGGIYAHHLGDIVISKSYFWGNTAQLGGGGIGQNKGKLYIQNSTFAENISERGGGLYNRGESSYPPVLEIIHATFAYNEANHHSSGGALDVDGSASVINSLIAHNVSNNCSPANGMSFSSPGTFSTDGSCSSYIEQNPNLSPFNTQYGSGIYHLLWPSPLIDVLPRMFCSLDEDQLGNPRPYPEDYRCDPGAYEFGRKGYREPPPPPPDLPEPAGPSGLDEGSTGPSDGGDSSEGCIPFNAEEISVVLLNIPADTLVLPLYFRFPGSVPGQDEAEPSKFRAILGKLESYKCDQQGFEDRLYCMFNLTPDLPGSALDLTLFKDDCEDPSYSLPLVAIPELKGSAPGPKTQCSGDLGEDACVAAGGHMSSGGTGAPYCICP